MKALRWLLGLYKEGHRIKPDGVRYWIIASLAVPLTLFEIWLALRGSMQPLTIAILFVTVLYTVSFMTVSLGPRFRHVTVVDYLFAALSFVCSGYLLVQAPRYVEWISGISEFTKLDLIVGGTVLLLSLELLRRCVGFGLSMVVYALLAYVFFGHLLDGMFSHRQLSLAFFVEEMIISLNGGLFGAPVQVAATMAFLFILFGRFIEMTGGGKFFFDAAAAISGRAVGGVAKVAVVSSALFGTISGSPAADVMTTGSVTIPAMKRLGYSARFSGAVEAVASTGGSLLPPVMGAVVFLMAEFTGIEYWDIAKSALLTAFLYYFSVYFQVHLRAQAQNMRGLDDSEIAGFGQALREGWHTIIPFAVLIYFLIQGYTAGYVAACAALATLAMSWLQPGMGVTPKRFVDGCVNTLYALGPLVAAVAAAGLVIGALNITGLAGKLSSLIFALTGGALLPTLFIAAGITILLGMGMPVVAAYALVAVLVAPVLIEMGIEPLQAHLFLVYYSIMSAITPPIAIACYVASSIAETSPIDIATTAVRLALVAFIVPFMFMYRPELLLLGDWPQVAQAVVASIIGVYFMCIASEGWYRRNLAWWLRLPLFGAGLATIAPGMVYDVGGLLVGAAILVAVRVWQPATA